MTKETKKVKSLSIIVTYRVSYGGVEMPKQIYEQMVKASENGDEIEMHNYPDVFDWIVSNVRERDCLNWKAEIDKLS